MEKKKFKLCIGKKRKQKRYSWIFPRHETITVHSFNLSTNTHTLLDIYPICKICTQTLNASVCVCVREREREREERVCTFLTNYEWDVLSAQEKKRTRQAKNRLKHQPMWQRCLMFLSQRLIREDLIIPDEN
jgi:hypothetical protein